MSWPRYLERSRYGSTDAPDRADLDAPQPRLGPCLDCFPSYCDCHEKDTE